MDIEHEFHNETKKRWDMNAEHWDSYMGVNSNQFHRELIRPYTEQLLTINKESYVLDIACGNGNFSRRLVELGVRVKAIDFSSKMIEQAIKRTEASHDQISYEVVDATDEKALLLLGEGEFTHAVSNMALMDISNVEPLIRALSQLLKPSGHFIFSITHPCFQTPTTKTFDAEVNELGEMLQPPRISISNYVLETSYTDIAIKGQPVAHFMFHRPLHYYMNICFKFGFVLDGFIEPYFRANDERLKFDWADIPAVSIFRFKKLEG